MWRGCQHGSTFLQGSTMACFSDLLHLSSMNNAEEGSIPLVILLNNEL